MRDAQSKLDQVIAFTGKTITADDVATVLGLVGRDLLLDTLQAVADEDAPAAFALAARAVEMGYDLRAVCRELSRVVRDLLVLSVDPSRINDPEIAGEGERDRLKALAGALLARGSAARVRSADAARSRTSARAAQPRYHLEMALLRWIHLRKLVPIEDLIAGAARGSAHPRRHRAAAAPVRADGAESRPPRRPRRGDRRAANAARADASLAVASARTSVGTAATSPRLRRRSVAAGRRRSGSFKDALLAEIRKSKSGVLQHGRRAGAEDRSRPAIA